MRAIVLGAAALLLAACETTPIAETPATATVSGHVLYQETSALPRPGQLIVVLLEASRADAPATEMARQEIDILSGNGPPFPFELTYTPERLDPRGRYLVRAEVRDMGGDLRATTTDAYPVITQGAPRVLDVTVRSPNATAAAPPEEAAENTESVWRDLRGRGIDFRAVGNEPGWLLDLYADRLELSYNYGNDNVAAALPAPTYPVEGQTRYDVATQRGPLAIVIQRYPCQDVMSGEMFPARVTATIGGRTLEGCGRST